MWQILIIRVLHEKQISEFKNWRTNKLLVENEFKKLKTFDLDYFIGKGHFDEDGAQNYLVFQPMYRYILN